MGVLGAGIPQKSPEKAQAQGEEDLEGEVGGGATEK